MAGTYFIKFHSYGTWLHGDRDRSVDRRHNMPMSPFVAADRARADLVRAQMSQPPVRFGSAERHLIHTTIETVTVHRGWCLLALNVRTTHVHAVIRAADPPELVMNQLKAWSTRRLRQSGLSAAGAKVWSRHGSTRYLNTTSSIARAIEYTMFEQGSAP